MGLRDVNLRHSYRSDDADIASDFTIPCLREAWRYDRAAGYFSSRLFPLILRGLEPFVRHGGKIRLVTSPQLSPEDAESITQGYASRHFVIEERSREALDDLLATAPDVYAQLAWLVANSALDIKIALPRREPLVGIYHEKFGIFVDGIDAVAFSGSLNETYAAFQGNFEYIDVFASWLDVDRVTEKQTYFDRLWGGQTARLETMEFPDALRSQLIRSAPPDYIERRSLSPMVSLSGGREPMHHQILAMDAWENNNNCGILEMATGTGKTFTALTATKKLFDAEKVRSVVILAPYIAIADQWQAEAASILGVVPIVCHSMSGDWRAPLRAALALGRFENEKLCIVGLYDTASSEDFRSRILQLPGPVLLIADEVHNVTLDVADEIFCDTYELRLGLSATPERYLDEPGTQRTSDYFGGVIFRFTLAEAIASNILTPYDYHPIVCGPKDQEGNGPNPVKLQTFIDAFESTPAASSGYALVYCQPQQLEEVKHWLGHTMQKRIHTFTAEEDLLQRREILREFGDGHLFALVAMRCLDEGVDIPPTRSAFLLGSSQNPKQFVQRRGRVLRKYPGKTHASIYDFIYLPQPETKTKERELRKELTRFAEFALSASNSRAAFELIIGAAESRGIRLREYVVQGV